MQKRDLAVGGLKARAACIVEDYVLSYTAKYWGFYGTHFHSGIKCFCVGAVDTETGSTTTRHYNERNHVNELLAKTEAQKVWEELKAGLQRAPTAEECETDRQLLEAWEESARISAEVTKARVN